jgi:hypothetical protein
MGVVLFGVSALGLVGGVAWAGEGTPDDVCQSGPDASGAPSTASSDDTCVNSGDADGAADQEGSASSGDGVAGQVAGVVSAGDASVDATNRSDDVSVTTGDANATNIVDTLDVTAGVFKGDPSADDEVCESEPDASGVGSEATSARLCVNTGDADGAADQAADAASGDGVGGQVIGVVTSAGGSADLVLDNESTDSDVTTGNAEVTNIDPLIVSSVVFFVTPGGGGSGGT